MEFVKTFNYDTFLEIIIVVLGTIVVANVVTWSMMWISRRVVKKTATDLDDQIISALRKPIYYSILLTGVYFFSRIFIGGAVLDRMSLPLYQSALVIVWILFLTKLIKVLITHFKSHQRIEVITVQNAPLFLNVTIGAIWIIGGYIILSMWGIDMTAWIASAGVAGIAIGFAAKDTLANLISGLFILTDAPFKINDFIVLDSGDRGRVTHIGMRTTRLKTMDDIEITVPNSIIGNAVLKNESGGKGGRSFRVRIPFGVAYGTDVEYVEKLVYDIAEENSLIMEDPKPRVRFRVFGASSLDFELLVWVESSKKKGRAIHEINHAIYKSFAKNEIEIPYTKQDIYIKEYPQNSGNMQK